MMRVLRKLAQHVKTKEDLVVVGSDSEPDWVCSEDCTSFDVDELVHEKYSGEVIYRKSRLGALRFEHFPFNPDTDTVYLPIDPLPESKKNEEVLKISELLVLAGYRVEFCTRGNMPSFEDIRTDRES